MKYVSDLRVISFYKRRVKYEFWWKSQKIKNTIKNFRTTKFTIVFSLATIYRSVRIYVEFPSLSCHPNSPPTVRGKLSVIFVFLCRFLLLLIILLLSSNWNSFGKSFTPHCIVQYNIYTETDKYAYVVGNTRVFFLFFFLLTPRASSLYTLFFYYYLFILTLDVITI